MKKLFIIPLLAIACQLIFSQDYIPSREDMEKFFKTKTLVVMDQNPLNSYDSEIKEAMENEWTITEFEFIEYHEFEEKRRNPEYSFLYLVKVTFEKDKLNAIYRFLNLSLGGDYFDMTVMPDLVSVPVAYNHVEEDSYNYKLGILVRFIQNHLKLMYEKPEIIKNNIFQYYNENKGSVKGKKLMLLEQEMASDVNNKSRLSKVYPYDFEFVTKEEIKEAILYRDENAVFLHKVGPEGTRLNARCYKILIGAGDANFYYFDYHMINDKNPDGFLAKDFKKLSK